MRKNKHQCAVPAATHHGQAWRCPECGATWDFNENAGSLGDVFHGKNNRRTRAGGRVR